MDKSENTFVFLCVEPIRIFCETMMSRPQSRNSCKDYMLLFEATETIRFTNFTSFSCCCVGFVLVLSKLTR